MCNLYSITTNQQAIIDLFRVINRYVGNLPPIPGVFPDYPAPVIRNTEIGTELATMRWGMPPPPKIGGAPVTNIRNTSSLHWRMWLKPENRCLVPEVHEVRCEELLQHALVALFMPRASRSSRWWRGCSLSRSGSLTMTAWR
jgi:hypothetical protein